MKTTIWVKSITAAALLASLPQAHAGLIEVDDNLVYDEATNLTWMKDVLYIATVGDDQHKKLDDGKVQNWDFANDWANALTAFNYGEWKLPTLEEAQSILSYDEITDFFGDGTDGFDKDGNVRYQQFWTSDRFISPQNKEKAWWFDLTGNEGNVAITADNKIAWAVAEGDLRMSAPTTEVSEPQSIALFSLAIAGLLFSRKKLG